MGLKGNSRYYNYEVAVLNATGRNATLQNHRTNYQRDYLPDLVANRTLESIRMFSKNDVPFLLMASWPTPHDPFTPAPRDNGTFDGYQAHRTPNWNTTAAQNAEKHWFLRQLAAIDDDTEAFIDKVYQLRQESLQTIDRHISMFVTELKRLGKLDSTIIIYTSDNGFQLGQHRLAWDKRHLYEHDIRVPMIVRGPQVRKNVTVDQAVLNIDIAPTIVELVTQSTTPPFMMDGQSFVPLLENEAISEWRSDFLVSYHGEGDPTCGMWACPPPDWSHWHGGGVPDAINNTYHCLRTTSSSVSKNLSNTMYCRFDDDEDFVEFYNLTIDPWQLHNGADELDTNDRTALETRLGHFKTCVGANCRETFTNTGI